MQNSAVHPAHSVRRGVFRIRFLFLAVVAAFPALADSNASVEILSPQQWSSTFDVLTVEWVVKDFSSFEQSEHHVIIIVNGHVAHTSQKSQDSVRFGELNQGSYYIQAMLAKYDEIEGMDDVLSTAMV
eukprot:2728098-Rhodomonas_salina.1